jgi:hypothetical protein
MLVRWADRTSSAVEVRDPKNHWIVNLMNTEENGNVEKGFLIVKYLSEVCG